MRIDKFLKNSRIIKRRQVAKEACDAGRVEINGRPAKAGTEVEIGDQVQIRFGNRTMKFEVLNTLEHVNKADADSMFRVLEVEDE